MFKEPHVAIGYHVGQNILNYCRSYESREETQEDSGTFLSSNLQIAMQRGDMIPAL